MLTPEDISQVQKIVQQELGTNKFRYPKVQRHYHNGVDSPRIPQTNIIPSIKFSGTITFKETKVYTLYLNKVATPTSILFNGIVYDTFSPPRIFGIVNGSANLAPGYFFQPQTSSSVIAGGTVQSITQGCTSMLLDTGFATDSAVYASEYNLVDVYDSSDTQVACAKVTSFDNAQIQFTVTALTSGWSIVGYFTVS